ncbi:MFS family permease [Leucobacter exalbidus]|uniref:MFS family permease n=1 Tax=Leucobacter exalbidus TaxID=662960 RepID=A0A940PWV6_9MICO|nr:MFS transporter [Leucobacter exalbidus]MBP1326814.1 MFS family permease [Leucobacter exalbidus]
MASSDAGNRTNTSPNGGRRSAVLARYVLAATLVRSADGGAIVAIVLLAQTSGQPGWVAGLLGASITAPHLFGPFIARRLDTAPDGRKIIALAAVIHGVLLAIAALLLPVTWPVVPALLLIVSGLFGPMLTGGVSSRLPSIAGPAQLSQRRAQGWDVASYGFSGTLGPAVVAWAAATVSPLAATLLLAGAAVVGAAAVLTLPRQPGQLAAASVPSPMHTLAGILRSGPLRRTLGLTVVVAFSVAVLPIYAVVVGPVLGGAALAGTLIAGYGVGNLAGSVLLMIWPLRGDADKLTAVLAFTVALALATVIAMPNLATLLAAFAATGIVNALFFAATLAARSEYAPAQSRGQVFIWVGALKIAAGSAGTATAGLLIAGTAWLPVVLVAAITAASALWCAVSLAGQRGGTP